jgi:hypothetical protein
MGPRHPLSVIFRVFEAPCEALKKVGKRLLTGKRTGAYTPPLIANGAGRKAGTDAADSRVKALLSVDV